MSLDDLVTVNISAASPAPSVPGFGTALFMAYHTHHPEKRVLSYASTKEMTDDGWSVTEPGYLAAAQYFSQNPGPKTFKVGRRTTAFRQNIGLHFNSAVTGKVYSFTIGSTPITYTVPSSSTTTTVATAIDALIAAVPGVTGHSASVNVCAYQPAAGVLLDLKCTDPDIEVHNGTLSGDENGLTADIVAADAEDDDWYGLLIDSQTQPEILAAAAWTETNKKLFVFDTLDSLCFDQATTTDVLSAVKAAAYARTGGLFIRTQLLGYAAAAWMGGRFTATPGSDTWLYKTLAGVTVDNLTSGQMTVIKNKRGTVYTVRAGLNQTSGSGTTGSGEYFDVTRFIDWLHADIQIRVFSLLSGNAKIPFTDLGVETIKAAIRASLKQGVVNQGLADDPKPTVSAPKVADVSTIDRGNRNLPNVSFTGQLAGAVHTLTINGVVSV